MKKKWSKLDIKHTLALIHMLVKYRYCTELAEELNLKVDYNKVTRKVAVKIELNV